MSNAPEAEREQAKHLMQRRASKGGRARAAKLTSEERQEIARQAALTRWDAGGVPLPKAIYPGEIQLGSQSITCAVLEDGTRILTQESFLAAVGRSRRPPAGRGSVRLLDNGQVGLPPFLTDNLRPFISEDVLRSASPIAFRNLRGGKGIGYEATLLPKVCEVYLRARDANALLPNQEHLARASDLLMRSLAHVGIIALVDEVTGYQEIRARDELNRILEKYIAKELLAWTQHFPDEFFKEIYRLHGWEFRPGNHKHPGYVGRLINKLIYEQLPPGVLPKLQELNPVTERGYRRYKHFQFLTKETGDPALDRQISATMLLMRIADNKDEFYRLFDRAYPPKYPQQLPLLLEDPEARDAESDQTY